MAILYGVIAVLLTIAFVIWAWRTADRSGYFEGIKEELGIFPEKTKVIERKDTIS